MLQCDKTDVSEGIDINKTSESKECILCHYWYFKDVAYKFQPYVCNGSHAVSVMAYELKNIAALNAKGVDYRCVLWGISKNDGLQNKGVLQKDFSVMLVVNSPRFYHIGVMN